MTTIFLIRGWDTTDDGVSNTSDDGADDVNVGNSDGADVCFASDKDDTDYVMSEIMIILMATMFTNLIGKTLMLLMISEEKSNTYILLYETEKLLVICGTGFAQTCFRLICYFSTLQ